MIFPVQRSLLRKGATGPPARAGCLYGRGLQMSVASTPQKGSLWQEKLIENLESGPDFYLFCSHIQYESQEGAKDKLAQGSQVHISIRNDPQPLRTDPFHKAFTLPR